jgi:hypothetical protein
MSTQIEILSRMVEATHALDSLPPIQTEVRMHPADIEALRRQCGATKTPGPFVTWTGVLIIPDEAADRLPRRFP